MLGSLKQWFAATLRRQLVVGIVLVVATTMLLLILDLTNRQKNIVREQQSQQAIALAQSVAVSSSVWLASRDYSGLQEIVDGLNQYPDLQHAIVMNNSGEILAHTETERRGFYLLDLPAIPQQTIIRQDHLQIDVAKPITIVGNHIGWVRIGMHEKNLSDKLNKATRDGIIYALIAVILTFLLTMLTVRRLTSRLYAIQSVADAVQSGNREIRSQLSGIDEAAQLSRQFNNMLDTLAKREQEIIDSHQAQMQSESRMNQVMDVTGEGIWDWDIVQQQVRHNISWCHILGLDETQIEHSMSYFSGLLHKDDADNVMQKVQLCLQGKGVYSSEHRMIKNDGSVIWVQDRGDVVERDGDGKPLRMLGSIADITKRKQAEDRLRQINEELEERVLQRTVEMTAARDEAERASEAKSDFLSRMSHELRTPLNAILGFGQLLSTDPDQPLNALQLDNVEEILTAGQHLLALVNEVLELSRIESGRLDIKWEIVDIASLIGTAVSQMRALAEQRQITISLDINTQQLSAYTVEADKLRMHEVMTNLLSNAVKYNKVGGEIKVAIEPTGSQHLRISVTDSGHGIKQKNIERLFQPFERFESAYEAIEGTGIGLALTKRLLNAMQSDIQVESVYGQGSTFWFEMPCILTTSEMKISTK
ncbi:MAG: ATP-binding protein [Gammaproteobacteria bacterium]|nr:ATP-binding protein [Gammaproteobacteria bacterium]